MVIVLDLLILYINRTEYITAYGTWITKKVEKSGIGLF
jgi:DNA-binding PadR family transcriptional regulator